MDMDSRQDEEEDEMFNEFQKLKESNFLKKHMLIFISIISVIGISSFFIPEIYAIVPVYETQQSQKELRILSNIIAVKIYFCHEKRWI